MVEKQEKTRAKGTLWGFSLRNGADTCFANPAFHFRGWSISLECSQTQEGDGRFLMTFKPAITGD